jgi:hypothetical protein
MGTLHEDQYTFLITCRSVLFRMGNILEKSSRENPNTYFMYNNFFLKIVSFLDNVEKILYSRTGHR